VVGWADLEVQRGPQDKQQRAALLQQEKERRGKGGGMAALSDSEAELRRPKTVVEVSSRETAAPPQHGAPPGRLGGLPPASWGYHGKGWRGAACGSLSLVTLLGSVRCTQTPTANL
jgi:hypothetical protein